MAEKPQAKDSANRPLPQTPIGASKKTTVKASKKAANPTTVKKPAKESKGTAKGSKKTKATTKKSAAKKTTPKQDRAKLIDWSAAFEWYCSDMTRSYADVGKEFGVNKDTVARHAAKEEYTWMERRLSVIEKLEKRALKQRYKDASKRDDVHLKHFRAVITSSTNTVITEGKKGDSGDWSKMARAAKAGLEAIMGERIILGLPTLIARSEVLRDDEELPPALESQKTAEALAERAKRLKGMRNDG